MSGLPYGQMVEAALRSVIISSLKEIERNGLPEENGKQVNHFYIEFQSGFPGVKIPSYCREQWPDTMTIVLQHQFYGLEVDDEKFSVSLAFSGIQERLTIPFEAIVQFTDPQANFGLKFTPSKNVLSVVSTEEEKQAVAPKEIPDNVISFDAFRKKG